MQVTPEPSTVEMLRHLILSILYYLLHWFFVHWCVWFYSLMCCFFLSRIVVLFALIPRSDVFSFHVCIPNDLWCLFVDLLLQGKAWIFWFIESSYEYFRPPDRIIMMFRIQKHTSLAYLYIDIDIRVNQIINMDGRYVEHLILIIIIEIDNQYGW